MWLTKGREQQKFHRLLAIWSVVIILHFCTQKYSNRFSSSSNSEQLSDDLNETAPTVVKVYKPTNSSSSNVALCVMVKNETLYLDEWVDFHIALGFSPIIIYDNSDDFDLMYGVHIHPNDESMQSWYEVRADVRHHLKLIHFPTLSTPEYQGGPHRVSQFQCISKDAANSTFVSLFDADEFLGMYICTIICIRLKKLCFIFNYPTYSPFILSN